MFPATLTTDRLLLRPPTLEDAPAIFERYASDPEVTHFLRWLPHQSVEETRTFLETAPDGMTSWAICVDGDEAPCGMISAIDQGSTQEVGFVLSRGAWGRGIMTEAARRVVDELLKSPAVWRVSAHAHVENVASQRVLEKAGLRREGLLRRAFKIARTGDTPQDGYLFARVRDDLD